MTISTTEITFHVFLNCRCRLQPHNVPQWSCRSANLICACFYRPGHLFPLQIWQLTIWQEQEDGRKRKRCTPINHLVNKVQHCFNSQLFAWFSLGLRRLLSETLLFVGLGSHGEDWHLHLFHHIAGISCNRGLERKGSCLTNRKKCSWGWSQPVWWCALPVWREASGLWYRFHSLSVI